MALAISCPIVGDPQRGRAYAACGRSSLCSAASYLRGLRAARNDKGPSVNHGRCLVGAPKGEVPNQAGE